LLFLFHCHSKFTSHSHGDVSEWWNKNKKCNRVNVNAFWREMITGSRQSRVKYCGMMHLPQKQNQHRNSFWKSLLCTRSWEWKDCWEFSSKTCKWVNPVLLHE
jgi:hypothetical protein